MPPSPSSQIPRNDPVNRSSLAFHGSFSAPSSSHYGSELIPLRRFPFSSSSVKKQERSFLVPAPNGTNPSPSIPWNVLPLKGSRTGRECGVFLLSSPIPSRHSKQREVPWNFCSLSSGKARLRLPPPLGVKTRGKRWIFHFFPPQNSRIPGVLQPLSVQRGPSSVLEAATGRRDTEQFPLPKLLP